MTDSESKAHYIVPLSIKVGTSCHQGYHTKYRLVTVTGTNAPAADGSRGSNVHEVNLWQWQFVSGKPRLGGLTIKQTSARKDAASDKQKGVGQRPCGIARRLKPDSALRVVCDGMYPYV